MKKTIGIIGGMGPLATMDLFQKITQLTKATCDQDHIPILIHSNTAIADRSAAILSGGKSPLPEMIKSAQSLEAMGANLLIMPCNTAHYFYDDLVSCVNIPIIHMIKETAQEAVNRNFHTLALLCTTGTLETGIYQKAFGSSPKLLLPSSQGREAIMSMIYDGVKAGRKTWDTADLRNQLDDFVARGAQGFILGCTELPLAFEQYQLDYPTLDATEILASRAILLAGGQVAKS